MLQYQNFDITIDKDWNTMVSCYDMTCQDKLQIDNAAVDAILQQMRDHWQDINEIWVQETGLNLAKALFTDTIKNNYDAAKNKISQFLRVRLKIIPDILSQLPWEALSLNNEFLAVIEGTPLVRAIHNPIRREFVGKKPEEKLKILVVLANPKGLPPLAVNSEYDRIRKPLEQFLDKSIQLDPVLAGNFDNIKEKLDSEQYHILHFIGHGGMGENGGHLFLEENDGRARSFSEDDIRDLLLNQRSLGLVILNACETASPSTSQGFSGIAQKLAYSGHLSVIAMRFPIKDLTARLFSQEFYKNLAGSPIDGNLQRVRHSIMINKDYLGFINPILFLNASDGFLFTGIANPQEIDYRWAGPVLIGFQNLTMQLGRMEFLIEEMNTSLSTTNNLRLQDQADTLWSIQKGLEILAKFHKYARKDQKDSIDGMKKALCEIKKLYPIKEVDGLTLQNKIDDISSRYNALSLEAQDLYQQTVKEICKI